MIGLQVKSVLLPTKNIQYQDLPVSPQNARPQTLQNNTVVQTLILLFEILIRPETLVAALFFIFV